MAPVLAPFTSGDSTPGASPLRVAILDDDPVFRAFLSKSLTRLGHTVVCTASTIDIARRQLDTLSIDAVTVDVVLRGESGLDFLRWAHQAHPRVLTVVVTAGTEKGARTGVDAIFLGAAALLTKPARAELEGFEAELRRVFQGPAHGGRRVRASGLRPGLAPAARRELLAVGASTGGPPMLLTLLRSLGASFDVPIVITQHMPEVHVPYLAELLQQQSGRPVVVPEDGAPVSRGVTYLAGRGRHLTVERRGAALAVKLVDSPAVHHCKPAVDPMFHSVARVAPGTALGVVMTGMGADGALGAAALRERGNPVLVQDEASSVVWGMPGSVVAAGAADAVYPGERLAAGVLEWMGFVNSPTGAS